MAVGKVVITRSGGYDPECGGGEPCWRNPETGYMEYCPKHEAFIADKAMEIDAKRGTKTLTDDQLQEIAEQEMGY